MSNKIDIRQNEYRSTPNLIGGAANLTGDTLLANIDAELGKLFEDRNVMLTDGGLITYDGAQLTFTEALNIVVNSKIAGGSPVIISLGSTARAFSATNRMLYAVIDRVAGTSTVTADAATLPAVTNANQEVFLIAKRVDAADGTKRIYWRNGMGQNEGQTLRLGAAGAGSGGGVNPSPAPGYKWVEFDVFDVNKTSSDSKVDSTYTNATYSAAKQVYQLNVDKTKTVAAGTTASAIVANSAPSGFASGDILFYPKYARRSLMFGLGTNTIAYSDDDGTTWTGLGTGIFSTMGRGAAWNGTRFVAVGAGTNTLAHSTNGTSWTGLGTSIFTSEGRGVCWNGSRFVAVGAGTNSIAYSTDGITWTGLGTSIFSTNGVRICWNGTRFVAVGNGTNSIAYSNDGITWTGLGTSIFSTNGEDVCWNGSVFVAVGTGTNGLAYSYDGITWVGLGVSFGSSITSICFDGLKFIAGTSSGTIIISSDGVNWASQGSVFSGNQCYSLSFNGNKIIASVLGSTQYYSTDGLTWTASVSTPFSTLGAGSASSPAPYLYPAVNTLVTISSNAAAGQWRRITSVAGSTINVDAAFSAIPTTGEKLVISQAVWTKDLVNYGSSTERTRARDFFSGKILDTIVDYNDSLTAGDNTPDRVNLNRIMMSSSNSGAITDTGIPTSDKFVATLQRPIRAETIQKHTLYTNTVQERFFLCFFADPYNPDVTTTCNLLNYQASFYGDSSSINSGVLEDALCFSDNSTTPHNCTVSTSGGLTSVVLDWSFIPNIRNGESQIEVFVDGKRISKFISSVKTPTSSDLYWNEQTDGLGLYRKVTFTTDLSVSPVEIKILKRFGVNQDISVASTAKLNQLFDFVVGSAAQVTAGIATHSTLSDAVTAAVNGQSILVLNNVTITDAPTVNKRLMIVGKGNGSTITGNLTVTSAAAKSIFSNLRIDGNITFQAGADFCFMTNCHQSSGKTYSNDVSNTSNVHVIITE